ncbi:MAG: hypothetical protein L6Q63_17205 [Giesbergeria sp.]|nr:hypothetical protein [Giesbergeria sp.]
MTLLSTSLNPALRAHPRTGAAVQWLEAALLAAVLALLALALWGPVLHDHPHQHGFADQRTLWGIPCALDVLSNLPFALAGAWGLVLLGRVRPGVLDAATRATAGLFCAGLLLTAAASSWYHWQPDNAGLLWDRLGMAVAFAGMLGLAAAQRVSPRAGSATALVALAAGPLAVLWWAHTSNLLPWAVVQLGGMLLVLALACLQQRAGPLALRLGAVIAWYGAAKLLELGDHAVFEATGQWVAGHSLKHLAAAAAAWPVLRALHSVTGRGHGAALAGGHNGAPCPHGACSQR